MPSLLLRVRVGYGSRQTGLQWSEKSRSSGFSLFGRWRKSEGLRDTRSMAGFYLSGPCLLANYSGR